VVVEGLGGGGGEAEAWGGGTETLVPELEKQQGYGAGGLCFQQRHILPLSDWALVFYMFSQ
jgi:hypothetical protein